jgi:Ser/Thr protein kinase RdoA (MazF antagonist)
MAEFDHLPVARQQALAGELASAALSHWGLQGAELTLLKHRENSVFRVDRSLGGPCVLRVHRQGYHSDQALASELQWLDALREAGVQATRCIRCRSGAPFVRVSTADLPEGRQCDLLEWVPGEPIGSLENGVHLPEAVLREVYRQAGEQAARIHNHGENWTPPANFLRLSWDENGYFGETGAICGRYRDLEELKAEELALLNRARDATRQALERFGKDPDRYGMVHGDFLPENLFYDGKVLRLIDWDDTGFGWHLHDFATALFPHLGQQSHDLALAAMVEGYRAHRALPDAHLAMLPYLTMARALSYVGWVHSRREAGRALAPLAVAVACALAESLPDFTPARGAPKR